MSSPDDRDVDAPAAGTPTPTEPTSGSDVDPATDPASAPDGASDPAAADPVPRGPLYLDFVGRSHVGLIRKNNQDSGYASASLLLVADGMGGAAAGDLASAVAVATTREADRAVTGEEMLDVLSGAVRRANTKIADLVADDHALEGMGTTVSGAMFDGSRLGLCHIGDSRIYRLRDGELERLTHDHSWVQSLIDDGKLTEEEAAYHPHRSLLLKVLNGHPTNDPDTSITEVRPGDRILLCSDGLCGLVEDDEILDRASAHSLQEALDDLLEAALQAGGVDNITIVLADVVDTAPAAAPAAISLGAVTERDIPELAPITVDLGDGSGEADDESDEPVRPAAPAPLPEQDDEDRRYAMSTAPKRRWLRRVVALLATVLLLLGIGVGGVAWGRTQYYVGVSGGNVAIYQGLSQNVLGFPLSRVYEVQEVAVDDLPPYQREQVRQSLSADSLDGAYRTVQVLQQAAETCRQQRQTPPTASPSASPSGSPSGTTAPSGSATATGPAGTPGAPVTPGPSGSAQATGGPATGSPAAPPGSASPSSTPSGTPGQPQQECV